MILVRYLSTILAEILINLSSIPSDPVALFALSDLSCLYRSQKLEVSQNSRSLAKRFLLWLQPLGSVVIKNFCCFFWSFLWTLFSSRVMLSFVMIPLLVKKGLITFQNDLLHTFFCWQFFKVYTFFSLFGHAVAFDSFIFIGQEVFLRRPLEVSKFLDLDLLIICLYLFILS